MYEPHRVFRLARGAGRESGGILEGHQQDSYAHSCRPPEVDCAHPSRAL
jgi:hypothetical protein